MLNYGAREETEDEENGCGVRRAARHQFLEPNADLVRPESLPVVRVQQLCSNSESYIVCAILHWQADERGATVALEKHRCCCDCFTVTSHVKVLGCH